MVKILVVLGDGGHSTEMLKLLELLGPDYAYSYMMATHDTISEEKIAHLAGAQTPAGLARERMEETIAIAGFLPVERDGRFNQCPAVDTDKPHSAPPVH